MSIMIRIENHVTQKFVLVQLSVLILEVLVSHGFVCRHMQRCGGVNSCLLERGVAAPPGPVLKPPCECGFLDFLEVVVANLRNIGLEKMKRFNDK